MWGGGEKGRDFAPLVIVEIQITDLTLAGRHRLTFLPLYLRDSPVLAGKTSSTAAVTTTKTAASMPPPPLRKNNLIAECSTWSGTNHSRAENDEPSHRNPGAVTTVSVAATIRVAASLVDGGLSADAAANRSVAHVAGEAVGVGKAPPGASELYENNASIQNTSFVNDLKFNRKVVVTTHAQRFLEILRQSDF
jgi:hypothetical protein